MLQDNGGRLIFLGLSQEREPIWLFLLICSRLHHACTTKKHKTAHATLFTRSSGSGRQSMLHNRHTAFLFFSQATKE